VTQSPSPALAAQAEPAAPTRRDRMRAATMDEITATARRLLVEQGPDAASLRAIAREMGMTAPGLYRYYGSREELIRHVIATIFRELSGDIHRAIDREALGTAAAAVYRGTASPAEVRRHLASKMVAACREFRRWGLGHKEEFALLFGVPLPGFDDGRFDIAQECALEFAGTFYTLFTELWKANPFPVPGPGEIDERLLAQLGRLRATCTPTCRTACSWYSCAAGCCSTARWRWRPSATSGSRSRTRPRCSSTRSPTWPAW
jgi:AcrR family transcriptional regulator